MKTVNQIYAAPQVEVINLEIEDAILSDSEVISNGVTVDPFEELTGRY